MLYPSQMNIATITPIRAQRARFRFRSQAPTVYVARNSAIEGMTLSPTCRAWAAMNKALTTISTASGNRLRIARGKDKSTAHRSCSHSGGAEPRANAPTLLINTIAASAPTRTSNAIHTSCRCSAGVGRGRRQVLHTGSSAALIGRS